MSKGQARCRSTFYFDGKQYECAGKTQKEADQKAAIKKNNLERGEIGISSNMTVYRWAIEWLETYKKPNIGERWYKDCKRRIDNLFIPSIHNVKLKDVKDIHLQKIINNCSGKSKSEIDKSIDLVQAIFRQARISRLIVFDPSESLIAPVAIDGTHRSITEIERKHILKIAETHKAGLWVKLMLLCGLRPAETAALSWKDIDFKNKRLNISFSMNNETNLLKEPKTKSGVRSIPIPEGLLSDLKERRTELFDAVLLQEKGKCRHTESSRKRLWKSFINEVDISMGAKYEKRKAIDGKMRLTKTLSIVAPDLTPYCLRHTYCTDLEEAGVPINVASYLMGHANIHVTSKYYTHTRDKTIKQAARKIEKFNSSKNGNNNGTQKIKLKILRLQRHKIKASG